MLAAETFTDYAQKPLFSIGYGEIGDSAKEAKTALAKILHLAQAWDCVSLLENADIILSHKTSAMKHNTLVNMFRKALDHFTGFLFLTSSGVGAFDGTLLSRSHIVLYLNPPLQESILKIWTVLLRSIDVRNIDYFEDSVISCALSENHQSRWNGRQI